MIDWSKYFDRIYCLHFLTPSYQKRKSLMQFQLERVGILHSPVFQWHYSYKTDFDKKFEQYVIDHTPHLAARTHSPQIVNVSLHHYNALREALTAGCKNVLIIEDDIRFLKDLNKIEQILQNKPKDANVILYDKFIFSYSAIKTIKPFNQYFSTFDILSSAACYELDRKGMKKIIKLLQLDLHHVDGFFYDSNCMRSLIHYCTTENMAVQGFFRNNNTHWKKEQTSSKNLTRYYKYLNVDFDKYMIRKDGLPYYYGDWIDD